MIKNENLTNDSLKTYDDSNFAIISNDLTFVKVSKSFADCLGFIPKQIEGKEIFKIMPFLSDNGLNKEILDNLLKRDFFCFEDVFSHPFEKEEKLYISFCKIESSFCLHILSNSDNMFEYDFSNKGITFKDIFNSVSDMILIVDKNIKIVAANSSFYAKSGYVKSINFNDLLKDAKYINIQSIINMCFVDGNHHANEYKIIFNNIEAWYHVNCFPIFSKHNENHLVIIFFRNIDSSKAYIQKLQNLTDDLENQLNKKNTELQFITNRLKKEIEEKNKLADSLHESESFISVFWNFILAGVVVIDASTMKIVDINLQAQKMIGLDKSEIIGKICHVFICPAEKGNCPIIDKCGVVDNSERLLINKNGEQIPIIKTVSRVTINGKLHLIETFLDNSERKKINDLEKFQEENLKRIINEKTDDFNTTILKLKEANLKLIESEKNKNIFFKNISHELRTPLTGILGFATLLKDGHFGSLNQKQASYVNQIEICGKHQIELINNLLDIAKNESKFYNIVSKECKFNELVLNVADFFESQFLEKKQEFTIELDNSVNRVNIDVQKIRAVLSNIISNSIKFTNLYGKIHLQTKLNDDAILISVKDNGIGISEESKKKLFSNIKNENDYNENYSKGMGVGLFLTKCYIELHGGEIWIDSEINKGTKITFSIPRNLMID